MSTTKSLIPSLLIAFIICPLFFIGCGDSTSPEPSPELAVSGATLDFGSEDDSKTFTISNNGGGTLEWSITTDRGWLAVNPQTGSTSSEVDQVVVNVNRDGISDGAYSGTITVSPAEGIARTIDVSMVVPPPELSVSVFSLDFGADETVKTFSIENNGGGTLTWNLTDDADWCTVTPTSGTTGSEIDEISVRVDRFLLSPGEYLGTIELTSNVGDESISVSMSKGERIWSYEFPLTNTGLDLTWECYDYNAVSGEDYWGVTYDATLEKTVAWCAGRGDHDAGLYASNMDARMSLKSDEVVDIRSYDDITIRFKMKYDTEFGYDYIRFIILGSDNTWYYLDSTHWWGTDLVWREYDVSLSDFSDVAPSNFLRIAFFFNSDISEVMRGAYVADIEVWGE